MNLKWTNTQKVLKEYAKSLRSVYINKLEESGSNQANALCKNIETIVEAEGKAFKIEIELEEYWKYIEYGRKPGKFPPLDAIQQWIEAKAIMPWDNGSNPIPTKKSLAFLIGRSIKEKGIPPKNFLSDSNEEVYVNFEKALTEALTKDITKEVTDSFTNIPFLTIG